jgi:hypothetical protein
MPPARIERRHVIDGAVVVVVVAFLGLAAAFLVDSVQTQSSYDTLAAHRVTVTERSRVCLDDMCSLNYDYRGTHFTDDLPLGDKTTFFVDPGDPSIRMSVVAFDGGPGETTVVDAFAALFLFAALAVATAHGVRIQRRRRTGKDRPSPWRVPLAPEDDPDVIPFSGPEPPEPGPLVPGQYLRLLPGDPLDVVEELPSHRMDHVQVLLGNGRLVLDTPVERHTFALPGSGVVTHDDEVKRLVLVVAARRAMGHVNDPDRFLVAIDGAGRTVGRLDVSDRWGLSATGLRRICSDGGLEFSVEHYRSDRELLAARPAWITASAELALEHPTAENVREFGLALWIGTGIALSLLGATGMELVFATPVRFVVFTMAGGGLVVAGVIGVWGRMTWHHRQYRWPRRVQ